MSTDADWDKWGEIDPYYGVLSSDEYRQDNLNEDSRTKFFRSGAEYIDRTLHNVRNHLDTGFQPERCLDFGCGVGRLVIPLAGLSKTLSGSTCLIICWPRLRQTAGKETLRTSLS